jgi:hypothetical protein
MDGWAASEDLIVVTPPDARAGSRIFAFLLSKLGRRQLLRTSYGTSIPHLNPEGVASIRVPILPVELADEVETAIAARVAADAQEERAIAQVESWLA